MHTLSTYIPTDRRRALAQNMALPHHARGAVLFADISGFTPLTEALALRMGPRRGADALARQLNRVYNTLIEPVHRHGGSVIGFSGDAITCWFDASHHPLHPESEPDLLRAVTRVALAAAEAQQKAMAQFAAVEIVPGVTLSLSLKVAVAAGPVRRFLVGEPTRQVVDVLAGTLLDRMAAAEGAAENGEIVLDAQTAQHVQDAVCIREWRTLDGESFAVYTPGDDHSSSIENSAATDTAGSSLPPVLPTEVLSLREEQMRPWVLPALYERLKMGQERFVAELRPAAALFVKFSGLDYDHDEGAGDKLDAYIRWVQSILDRYEGSLIQVTTGDKGSYLYMAFGAPLAHDDDASRSVAAALELRQPPPHLSFITGVQLGVSQGRMRVGAYGSETRRTYGVLGDATNLAARLMSHASPGQILISETVADAVRSHYHIIDMGRIAFKGKGAAQATYAVDGRPAHALHRPATLYAQKLVGREAELAELETLCAAVSERGTGHVLRIVGEAGIGKSHLANAACHLATERGLRIVTAACQSTARDSAYFALRRLLRHLLELPDERQTDAAENGQALLDHLEIVVTRLHPEGWLRLPLLGDILGISIPDNETTAAFDAQLRREALITLVLEIVQAHARAHPLLLLLDDVHWLDEASQTIVVALTRAAADAPVLLALAHRPVDEHTHPWLDELSHLERETTMAIHELSREGIAALVEQKLDGEVAPIALSLVQALSQGNPFYTEELVEAMLDNGRLVREEGTWTISKESFASLRDADCLVHAREQWMVRAHAPLAAVDLGIPDSIHGLVLSRLDRLPEPVKMTIKVASVIGRAFELDLLAHAHPVLPSATELDQQIGMLLARDFARVEAPAPQHRYIFKHNITQEVVYRTLLEDQRYELHWAVAQSLENLRPNETEQLAYHFYNSDLTQPRMRAKALHYLGAAGEKSQREYANETALSYFERALALESRWPWLKAKAEVLHVLGRRDEEHETLTGAVDPPPLDYALLWGDYYDAVSDYAQAANAVEQGLQLAESTENHAGVAQCLNRLGMIAWRQGEYATAEKAYTRARNVAHQQDTLHAEEAEACYGLGLVYRQLGRFDGARAEFERDLALNRQLSNRKNEARALNALGVVEYFNRSYDSALAFFQQALDIRRAIGERAGVGGSMLSIAQTLGSMGDHGRAEPMLREAVGIYQQINDRWSEQLIWNELGILYAAVGSYEEAETCLNRGLSISREIGAEPVQAYILCNLGQVLRERYQLREAQRVLSSGLAIAKEQGDTHLQAIYLNDLALVSLAMRHFHRAIDQAEESMALFLEIDLPLPTTASHTTIAQAYLELENLTEARAHVQEALRILDECEGEGPDYPHRDYWHCYQVLRYAGEGAEADRALSEAHRLLLEQAAKISDAAMRRSYLEKIAVHRAIVEVAEQTLRA